MNTRVIIGIVLSFGSVVLADDSMQAELNTLNGDVIRATIESISPKGVVAYRLDSQVQQVILDDLLNIIPAPSEPSQADNQPHVCVLADGGEISGVVQSSASAGSRSIRIKPAWGEPVDVPFSAIAAISLSRKNNAHWGQFQTRVRERKPGRDQIVLIRDGKIAVAPGSLEGFDAGGWEFRFGGQSRSGTLEEAYGFILGAPAAKAADFLTKCSFVGGDRLSTRIDSADSQTLTLSAGQFGTFKVPWTSVERIDLASGRLVYLSDLKPFESIQRSIVTGDWPVQHDRTVVGKPLRLRGRTYRKGLGVHSYSSLTYQLNGGFERFSAMLGIDDSSGTQGVVIFRVFCDRLKLYESDHVRVGDKPVAVSLDLQDKQSITLECDYGEGLDIGDHAIWADAKLIRLKKSEGVK